MHKILGLIVGLALAADGLFMLADPAAWYAAIPGVAMTGPFNPHFVRDIGCAYVVAGAGVAALAVDARARPAALAGGAFLALHAFVHFWDWASGREALHTFINDLPPVFAPPAIVLWLARPGSASRKGEDHAEMVDPAPRRRL